MIFVSKLEILEEYVSLMTKYQSEYNRNVDCIIKTDALHEHIRLLSETLAEKEINEEKLTTQQQQMKKLMTLLVPTTPLLSINKKQNEKKVCHQKETKQQMLILYYYYYCYCLFRHLDVKLNDTYENHSHHLLNRNLLLFSYCLVVNKIKAEYVFFLSFLLSFLVRLKY